MLLQTYKHYFLIDLSKTAVLVINMQNDFCHVDGFCSQMFGANLSYIRAIIPRIQKVVNWARRYKILVVYTKESHLPALSNVSQSKNLRYANAGYPVGTPGKMGRFLIQGEQGTALIDELQLLETEQ